jgi:hypothetical protein
MLLEWTTQSAYALTELAAFTATLLVVLSTVGFALAIFILYLNTLSFSILRPLYENVLPTAIAFLHEPITTGDKKGETVSVVFLGYKEQRNLFSGRNEQRRNVFVRIWVHVYFTILSSIIVLWGLSIFSDTVLYRKTTNCQDLSVKDTDSTCFLLSDRDIPKVVKQMIDNEGGLVPCEEVQDYLLTTNTTYDLEVICYQSQLNPLAALGVAYGTMKSIAFIVITVLSVLLRNTRKLEKKNHKIVFICFQSVFSVLVIIGTVAGVSALHKMAGTRNTAFDYLRGERFYHCSVVVLLSVTVVTSVGLFPWWAFQPLGPPQKLDAKVLLEDQKQLHGLVHRLVLHQKFSTGVATMIEEAVDFVTDNAFEIITGDKNGLEEEGGDQDDQNTPLLSPPSSGRDN